jgi:hypothetical protein
MTAKAHRAIPGKLYGGNLPCSQSDAGAENGGHGPYGIDDYEAYESVLSELFVRVSQVSKVLDAHSSPTMAGPSHLLEEDKRTGELRFRAGNYYPVDSSDLPVPQYITWDASLDANFRQIDILLNQLYSLSEMGSAIFGDLQNKAGSVPSGTAMRRLMMSPLAKAARLRNAFDGPLKTILSYAVGGLTDEQITVKWRDGLPDDELEAAQIAQIRTGNRQTQSQFSAIRALDGAGEDDAQAELDMIRGDEDFAGGGQTQPGETVTGDGE